MSKKIIWVICILILLTISCQMMDDIMNQLAASPTEDASQGFALTQVGNYVAQGLTMTAQVAVSLSTITPSPIAIPLTTTTQFAPVQEFPVDANPTLPLVAKLPTDTEVPQGQIPTPTCRYSAYIVAENVPAKKELPLNHNFTKTWRLRNNGTCDWQPSFELMCTKNCNIFGINGSNIITNRVVHPKEQIEINLPMRVPKDKNLVNKVVAATFMIRGDGKIFGVQPDGLTPLTVSIKVVD